MRYRAALAASLLLQCASPLPEPDPPAASRPAGRYEFTVDDLLRAKQLERYRSPIRRFAAVTGGGPIVVEDRRCLGEGYRARQGLFEARIGVKASDLPGAEGSEYVGRIELLAAGILVADLCSGQTFCRAAAFTEAAIDAVLPPEARLADPRAAETFAAYERSH